MAGKRADKNPNILETAIDGDVDKDRINRALDAYFVALDELLFPDSLELCARVPSGFAKLRGIIHEHMLSSKDHFASIIQEINERAGLYVSKEFVHLVDRDRALWEMAENGEEPNLSPIFAVRACVDKGLPYEAHIGVDTSAPMARTLAGDIDYSYVKSENQFRIHPSFLAKRRYHDSHTQKGRGCIDIAVTHTGCGRMAQVLANERGSNTTIPRLGDVLDHLEAFGPLLFNYASLRSYWRMQKNEGSAVIVPDKGMLVSVLGKMAQRQGLHLLAGHERYISPIEIYDKHTGDMIVGVDNWSILTNSYVLNSGGYTASVLKELSEKNELFSIGSEKGELFPIISDHGSIKQGKHTYQDLQENWFDTQTALVDVTETLWKIYRDKEHPEHNSISAFANRYLDAALGYMDEDMRKNVRAIDKRRLVHHLFHITSYAYTLDTFTIGNKPGDHIEDHLATGDAESATKRHLALGQGDLDDLEAYEIFTGYSVMLHTPHVKDGNPVPLMVKTDTDRSTDRPISGEETKAAMFNFNEVLQLWPYIMVGDIIPVVAIRSKQINLGVSRVGRSVIGAFQSIVGLLEKYNSELPDFVPANNSRGEIVLVPAYDILQIAINVAGDLRSFRTKVAEFADKQSRPELQRQYRA